VLFKFKRLCGGRLRSANVAADKPGADRRKSRQPEQFTIDFQCVARQGCIPGKTGTDAAIAVSGVTTFP
jgi:hypothetical protein